MAGESLVKRQTADTELLIDVGESSRIAEQSAEYEVRSFVGPSTPSIRGTSLPTNLGVEQGTWLGDDPMYLGTAKRHVSGRGDHYSAHYGADVKNYSPEYGPKNRLRNEFTTRNPFEEYLEPQV